MSLKLRIIEKRKRAGSTQKCDREFETSLFQAIQAAYISVLLEVCLITVHILWILNQYILNQNILNQ